MSGHICRPYRGDNSASQARAGLRTPWPGRNGPGGCAGTHRHGTMTVAARPAWCSRRAVVNNVQLPIGGN